MKVYVYAVLALLVLGTAAVQRAHAALAMASTNSVDLGRIYPYAGSTNTFLFTNRGRSDIAVLDALSTCPCIQGVKNPQLLKPGDTYTLETHFSARTVHGKFTRGIWLVTDDPAHPRFLVKVTGEVLPLFAGLPEQEIVLTSPVDSVTFTNELIFTATTTNFFLKEPLHNRLLQKSVSSTLKQEGGQYRLTTIIRPARYMQSAVVKLPVEGPRPTDPVEIKFKIAAGAQLRASPARLIVPALDQSFTKTFYINTQTPDYRPDELTWSPQIAGVEIRKQLYSGSPAQQPAAEAGDPPAPRRTGSTRYTCTLTISPEALRQLMQMDEPALTFTFPDHKPVKVQLSALAP